MSHKTFPKDGVKKLKQTTHELKALLNQRDKEIRFLRQELEAIMRPVRARKVEEAKPTYDEWRKDFVRRFKQDVLKKKEG